jgi:hypothetical protein
MQLLEMSDERTRELKLLEYSRLDYLTFTERRIYLRAGGIDGEEEEPEPVEAWKKYLAMAVVLLYNLGSAFYVCLFG